MIEALIYAYTALVGATIGSFLNVCIYRWPAEQSVIRPRSRCPGCGNGIAWYDNIPILSWILLRGKCRHCATPISVQYPIIEAAVALIFVAAVALHGVSVEAVRAAAFLTILLGIAMTDAREMVIPDQFSLGGMVIGLLLAAIPGGFPLLRAVLGAATGFILLWAVKLVAEKAFKKPALGVGDIHMMALVGAFLGVSGTLLTILLGSLLGLVVGIPLTYARGGLTVLGTYLPLGTFLALGAAVAHVWGDAIIAMYLAWIGV